MLIPFQWIGLFATVTVFAVMFALGLMLGREQIAAALQRRVVLAAVVFAVVVPVPALAVLALKVFALKGPVAVGIVLMAISPGAPVALRRALDAGGNRAFAPALHLAIVMLAVVTVPATVAILDWIFAADFTVTPFHIGRQVFFAQLLPMALGAALRAFRPAIAAKLETPLGRVGNVLLLLLGVAGAGRPAGDHRRGGLDADDRRRGDDAVRAGGRRGLRVARRRRCVPPRRSRRRCATRGWRS